MLSNFGTNVKNYLKENGSKELPWLILCFLILLPTKLVEPLYQGLDPSWNISLSMAVRDQLVFGKDFIFTYGPLGIFAAKHSFVWSKWTILGFECFVLGCAMFIARSALKKSEYHPLCYLVVPLILFILKAGSLIHLLPPIFIFFIFHAIQSKSKPALLLSGLIAVICFYIKVNYGIILMGLFSIAIVFFLIKKVFDFFTLLILVLIPLVIFIVLSFLLNVDLKGYVVSSIHLINAYNDAMYVTLRLTHKHMILAALILLSFSLGVLSSARVFFKKPEIALLILFSGFYLYLIFKNGFVRADGHRYEFFQQCILPFSLVWLWIEKDLKKRWTIFSGVTLFLCLTAFFIIEPPEYGPVHKMAKTDYYKDVFTDVSYKNNFKLKTKYPDTIPSRYIQEIGNSSVDIIPWEIAEIERNHLKYNPRPVIQSYSAYNQYLDDRNYEKYSSASAPEYILYSTATIDMRYPFWDESNTKRAMLTHFEVIDRDSVLEKEFFFDETYYRRKYKDVLLEIEKGNIQSGYQHYLNSGRKEGRNPNEKMGQYLLLKKRMTPLELDTLREEEINFQLNQEYKIPNSANLLYLYAKIEYSLKGKLKRILFQPPPLNVELTYEDGSKSLFKAVLPILKTGILVNKSIHNNYEAGLFFRHSGEKNPKIVSIKFMADSGFSPEISGVIREMKLADK